MAAFNGAMLLLSPFAGVLVDRVSADVVCEPVASGCRFCSSSSLLYLSHRWGLCFPWRLAAFARDHVRIARALHRDDLQRASSFSLDRRTGDLGRRRARLVARYSVIQFSRHVSGVRDRRGELAIAWCVADCDCNRPNHAATLRARLRAAAAMRQGFASCCAIARC